MKECVCHNTNNMFKKNKVIPLLYWGDISNNFVQQVINNNVTNINLKKQMQLPFK